MLAVILDSSMLLEMPNKFSRSFDDKKGDKHPSSSYYVLGCYQVKQKKNEKMDFEDVATCTFE